MARPNTPRSQTKEMQEYLLTYMPILTDALTEMGLHRPNDALAFLSQYLLQRSTYPTAVSTSASILAYAGGVAQSSSPPLRIIIAGAPCSGKGTLSEFIKSTYGLYHLSTGDLLRGEISRGTELGLRAATYMNQGALIPDELIIGIVKSVVQGDECMNRGWLLDGFPRTAIQAQALREAGIEADIFLQLHVPDNVLVDRVVGRRLDEQTGITYHVAFDPPPAGEIADRCVQRADDTEEKIRTRLEAFHAAIDAIQKQYQEVRVELDGDRPKQEIIKDIRAAIETVQKRVKALGGR